MLTLFYLYSINTGVRNLSFLQSNKRNSLYNIRANAFTIILSDKRLKQTTTSKTKIKVAKNSNIPEVYNVITYIEFDGYCPESKLKGELVEMRLNDMDFWESEKTGLQITTFPPYAAILQWRGEGKFRNSSERASNNIKGLLLAKPQLKKGCEIFPDENKVFDDLSDLADFIHSI